jgi:hypothetical protein
VDPNTAAHCVGAVSEEMAQRATNVRGAPPETESHHDQGENPVHVDGVGCLRRYRIGGWITRRDDSGCETVEEFEQLYGGDRAPRILEKGQPQRRHRAEPISASIKCPASFAWLQLR